MSGAAFGCLLTVDKDLLCCLFCKQGWQRQLSTKEACDRLCGLHSTGFDLHFSCQNSPVVCFLKLCFFHLLWTSSSDRPFAQQSEIGVIWHSKTRPITAVQSTMFWMFSLSPCCACSPISQTLVLKSNFLKREMGKGGLKILNSRTHNLWTQHHSFSKFPKLTFCFPFHMWPKQTNKANSLLKRKTTMRQQMPTLDDEMKKVIFWITNLLFKSGLALQSFEREHSLGDNCSTFAVSESPSQKQIAASGQKRRGKKSLALDKHCWLFFNVLIVTPFVSLSQTFFRFCVCVSFMMLSNVGKQIAASAWQMMFIFT